MSAVTVAMLVAINISDKALTNVGRYPLTSDERKILINAGYSLIDIENPDSSLIIKCKDYNKRTNNYINSCN